MKSVVSTQRTTPSSLGQGPIGSMSWLVGLMKATASG